MNNVANTSSLHLPYPWQQNHWQGIQQRIQQGKMPHAILLAGQQGIGKWQFARSLAEYLLCSTPRAGLACGQCRSCQLLLANTHPDNHICSPEDPDKPIKIEQIRQLSTLMSNTSQQGGYKVVVIGPVEQLNTYAANALLKNLEEPEGNTVFILVSHVIGAVLATIRSRCQLISFSPPSKADAVQWLQDLKVKDPAMLLDLAGGAPLLAKEMVEGDHLEQLQLFMTTLDKLAGAETTLHSPPDIRIAKDLLALNINHITLWWLQIIHRIVLQRHHSDGYDSLSDDNPTASAMMRIVVAAKAYNVQWLFKFSDKLLLIRQQHLRGANPNLQLLIEELLMDWQVIVQRS